MSRLSPKSNELRALFARSGNRCAFPGCTAHLINEKNLFIGQVCHIEGAEPGGERYNSNQSDEDRRAYSNLLLLCYPHHVETNDVVEYSTQKLREMKARHEQKFDLSPFKIDESLLFKISEELNKYWLRVEELHKSHIIPELAIKIDAHASFEDLSVAATNTCEEIIELQNILSTSDEALLPDVLAMLKCLGATEDFFGRHPEHLHRIQFRNWEVLNIGLTNTVGKLRVLLVQMEIKYLGVFLQINPKDKFARLKLETLKVEFESIAQNAGYAD